MSSADLFQVSAAAWDDLGLASHQRACTALVEIKDEVFDRVGSAVRSRRPLTERDVQRFIVGEFGRRGLESEGAPVVQANAHSGQVHYEPPADGSAPIGPGDWLLIDFWAREPGVRNVYADIAWGGYAGSAIPDRLQRVFDVVREARDLALERLCSAWKRGEVLRGWEMDRVARDRIVAAGFGDAFHHRTGHSMGVGRRLHALGVNIDDLETHDTRSILPRTGFSIEPAIYLPEFGVRLEVNVYMDPVTGPVVTTPIQHEIVRLT